MEKMEISYRIDALEKRANELKAYLTETIPGSFSDMITNTRQGIAGVEATISLGLIKSYETRAMPLDDFERLENAKKQYKEIKGQEITRTE